MPSLLEYPSDDTCLMHLVRHGATPHNQMRPPRLQGCGVDESLSEIGREQAARLAAHLAARPARAVYTSPMRRAVETAEAVAREHVARVETVAALHEVDVGRWEGRTWAEIQREDAHAYARYQEDPAGYGYPDGESLSALLARVADALAGIMQRHVGEEIVVVAHSVVNRAYLGDLLGVPPHRFRGTPQLNCADNLVRWKQGAAKVVTLNAVTHLM